MKYLLSIVNRISNYGSQQKKFWITFILIAFFVQQGNTQQSALPQDAYGVWIRGGTENYKLFDGFKGQRINYEWSDVQPNDSLHFKWDDLQKDLDYAYQNNTYVYASIMVGPDSPEWIYKNNLVPKVSTTASGEKWDYWPYYLDPDYKRLYFKLIEEFAHFLRTQPPEITKRIAYVQGMVGCTGDVGLYKGDAINPDYAISEAQEKVFYLEVFEQFKTHFNDGDEGKKIPLVFNGNAMHPITDPVQWAWMNNYIDPIVGFGIKGSAYMRGHHLTGEKDYIDTWKKYLVNPVGMQIFSRGEMDQTWTHPLYQINVPMGFYWGMLSGLNTGLSVWDITESAIEYAAGPSEDAAIVRDVFRTFNKYAPQIYPATASAAYIIFHEGLNAENTTKFPEAEFGNASQNNLKRYEAICAAYAERGAKMNDLEAASYGQVWQRNNQTGFNDAGWSIEEGNYERWIEQINPDETSRSLWRVRGKIDENSSIYDRFARSFHPDVDTMYFKYHNELFSTYLPKTLTYTITWLDQNAGSKWAFGYINKDGEIVKHEVEGKGDNTWKKETFTITDANISETVSKGANFFLINSDVVSEIFHGIEMDIERVGADDGSVSILSPQNGDEFILGSSVLVVTEGFDNQGIERIRFTVDDHDFTDIFSEPYALTFNDLELGKHELKVQLKDSLGYWSIADSIIISVIPEKDTLYVQSPVNGAEFYLGEDVLVTAYGYDYDDIQKISFRVNGGSFNDVFAPPYEYAFTGLSVGSHVFEAQMTDMIGNTILSEEVNVIVELPEDEVYITSPSTGDTIQLGEDVLVTTYAYDKDGIVKVRFKIDGGSFNGVSEPPYEYKFTGLTEGTHIIDVQMLDESGDRINAAPVVITVPGISPNSVSITQCSSDTLIPGDTHQFIATVNPSSATDKSVTWSSSNNSVATVDDNGLVYAIATGSAIITVTTNNAGFTDECTIVVDSEVNVGQLDEAMQIVEVYPNPASEVLNFRFLESGSKKIIRIYNVTGQLLISKSTYEKELSIDIKKFSSKEMLLIAKLISKEGISSFKIICINDN